MATILVIYDSVTGNTEGMARAIVEDIDRKDVKSVLKKLGEPFPLSILADANGIVLGSPVHYAYVTQKMRDFIGTLEEEKKAGRLGFGGKIEAVFGSYGWEGGIASEDMTFSNLSIGLDVQPALHMKIDVQLLPSIRAKHLDECRDFGASLAEKVSKQ